MCPVNGSYCLIAGRDQSSVISDDRTFRFLGLRVSHEQKHVAFPGADKFERLSNE